MEVLVMLDAVEVTKDLIRFNSVSSNSNVAVSDNLQDHMRAIGFTVERVEYRDPNGTDKVSLVGRKGEGDGGLALLGHSDVVPADGWTRDPFEPWIEDGKLYGRGSCDMKGSLSCMLVACEAYDSSDLKNPLYIVFTGDEEVGCQGAAEVVNRSRLFNEYGLRFGIIGEPTLMRVVRAHKGMVSIRGVSQGRAAHSSTGKGVNANLAMIPFLEEMRAIYDELTTETKYFDGDFDPPYADWNIGINDGGVAPNVTAPQSVCTINYRPLPRHDQEALMVRVRDAASRCGIEVDIRKIGDPFVTPNASDIIQAALQATGTDSAHTVSYGTDGLIFGSVMELVVMGPGDIQQAHTVNEWMDLEQFGHAIGIYRNMIDRFCI